MPNQSVFDQLDPTIQAQLLALVPAATRGGSGPSQSTRQSYIDQMIRSDVSMMWLACNKSAPEVVAALVKLGVEPSICYGNRDPVSFPCVAMMPLTKDPKSPERAKVLAVVKILLDHGADPCTIIKPRTKDPYCAFGMASCDPDLARLCLASGARMHKTQEGAGFLLEAWMAQVKTTKGAHIPLRIQALEMLLEAGLDGNAPFAHSGTNFLVACWSNMKLRTHLPRLLSLGLDPSVTGNGDGVSSRSFDTFFQTKLRQGSRGLLSDQIKVCLEAASLEVQTPTTKQASRSPRL